MNSPYKIAITLHELEQLCYFNRKDSTWPGDTIAHNVSNSLVDKGLAKRVEGNFVITELGQAFLKRVFRNKP